MNEENRNVKETRVAPGGMKSFFQKLSRGLMLPIAILPIAGLFLGVGAGIENIMRDVIGISEANQWYLLPQTIETIGDIIFGNLPILFAIGIAIAFAEDAGVAAFTAFVSWIVFNATQSIFIWDGVVENTKQVLWYSEVPNSVITSNVGITSLQTSVFGGIIVGWASAFIYKKFRTLTLPTVLGFFNGTRSVPIIALLTMPLLGFAFLLIWPVFGVALERFGTVLASAPYGLDALTFGLVERALIPFGLHHAFYTPLWYTSVGGSFYVIDTATGAQVASSFGNQNIWFAIQSYGLDYNSLLNGDVWMDSTIAGFTDGYWMYAPDGSMYTNSAGQAFVMTEGINPGAYLQGKYPIMIFGLPAAGAAMIMAAKKENREVAFSIIGAAAFTSFLTGITEPIEFTFLFLAPMLYVFHVIMAGISFWVLDLLHVSTGLTFSGGIIDYVIYGVLSNATGFHTSAWIIPLVGIVYIPIYYFGFYFYIVKMDIQTPGRGDGEIKMVSKKDYLDSKEKNSSSSTTEKSKNPREERILELIENLGGMDNLDSIDACITRLRLTVKKRELVNDQGLISMGAKGVVGKTAAIQVIFGAEADIFKTELLDIRKGNSSIKLEDLNKKEENKIEEPILKEEIKENLEESKVDEAPKKEASPKKVEPKKEKVINEIKDDKSKEEIVDDLSKLTIKEIKEKLDKMDVTYHSKLTKKELLEILKSKLN